MSLANGEFEFAGVKFGSAASGYPLLPGGYSVGAPEFRLQDADNPQGDGRVYGVDHISGVTHTWQVYALDDTQDRWAGAVRSAAALRAVWHDRRWRSTSRAVASMQIYHGDVERTIYGRPRNFSPNRRLARQGVMGLTFDWAAADDLAYGPEQSIPLSLVTPSLGGLTAPVVAPVTGSGDASSPPGVVTINSDTPVHFRLLFSGPVTNPTLRVGDLFEISWAGSLAHDRTLTIDTYPWARTVQRDDGVHLPGGLTVRTPPMSEMMLEPGTHQLVYTGVDPTNTSSAILVWRDAVRVV